MELNWMDFCEGWSRGVVSRDKARKENDGLLILF